MFTDEKTVLDCLSDELIVLIFDRLTLINKQSKQILTTADFVNKSSVQTRVILEAIDSMADGH